MHYEDLNKKNEPTGNSLCIFFAKVGCPGRIMANVISFKKDI